MKLDRELKKDYSRKKMTTKSSNSVIIKKLLLCFVITTVFVTACDEEGLTLERLQLEGKVVNAINTSEAITGASVNFLSNDGQEIAPSKLSDSNGEFLFSALELDDNSYRVVTKKEGFRDVETIISVRNGAVTGGNLTIAMPPIGAINLSQFSLNFGEAKTTETIEVINTSSISIEVNINIAEDWLSASESSVTLAGNTSQSITFTADRESLQFGVFNSGVIFDAVSQDIEDISITASVQKIDPSNPSVSVDKTNLDYGTNATTNTILISNKGTKSIDWTSSISDNWISIDTDSGTLAPGVEQMITVTVNRVNLAINTYNGTIIFTANNQETEVVIAMEVETVIVLDQDNDGVADDADADDDNDGLIEIFTIDDLNNVRNDLTASGASLVGGPISGFIGYELMNDLDFDNDAHYIDKSLKTEFTSGLGWLPIGTSSSSNQFNTIFDGNNHKISNLLINRTTTHNGLFGSTGLLSKIKNLSIGVKFLSGDSQTGGLVGSNAGDVDNCSVTGTINNSTDNDCGLLIGYHDQGSITNCYSIGSVTSSSFNVGGLIGAVGNSSSDNWSISNCYSNANVSGTSQTGGLVGFFNRGVGTVTSCYATGNITARGDNSGGFAGIASSSTSMTIISCYATGNVNSTNRDVGGFIGDNSETITSCYSIGSVSGSSRIGGFAGNSGSGISSTNYWDTTKSEIESSAGSATGLSTIAIQGVTSNTGIFITWSEDDWDFGDAMQYPVLKNMPNGIAAQR